MKTASWPTAQRLAEPTAQGLGRLGPRHADDHAVGPHEILDRRPLLEELAVRRHVHPAGPGLAHGGDGGLGAGDGGVEVDFHGALPLGAVGVFGDEPGDAPAGVVDQDVDAAPAIEQRGDRALPRAVGGQVTDGQLGLGGAAFEGFGLDLGRLVGVDVGDDQTGTLGGETVHDAAADVRPAPGDQYAGVS